jgi:DNA polymerase III delta prime subunit
MLGRMRPSGDLTPGVGPRGNAGPPSPPVVAGAPGAPVPPVAAVAPVPSVPPVARVPLLLIIGPPGVGKSSAARQLSHLLEGGGICSAYVDRDDFGIDGLLDEDPLVELEPILLARVAEGAGRLVVAWRIPSGVELTRFRAALAWADITVCRLRAETGELLDRIARAQQSFQRLHLQSIALEQAPHLERQAPEDILLATDEASPQAIAIEALRQWTTGTPSDGSERARTASPG